MCRVTHEQKLRAIRPTNFQNAHERIQGSTLSQPIHYGIGYWKRTILYRSFFFLMRRLTNGENDFVGDKLNDRILIRPIDKLCRPRSPIPNAIMRVDGAEVYIVERETDL